ncbi:response regulator [Altererythrobacter xixiisoli]|uniref:Regulatory protein VirG n=1 Tax=Croceibacterium xixiisoli TaxID=1476466 RepID=A0A6I4TUM9_9SPHN|nr:response regulator [Croceibacterium xixiisoli]
MKNQQIIDGEAASLAPASFLASPVSGVLSIDPKRNCLGKVLIVDGDGDTRFAIGEFLDFHGFSVFEADSAAAVRGLIADVSPDVVIVDVLVPGGDGLSIVRELSNQGSMSVIMLSALASDIDRIVGLEAGADDYLAKPVSLRELLARIRAVRRRITRMAEPASPSEEGVYRFAGWCMNVASRTLNAPSGARIPLSDGEFSLLRAFVERPQRVLSRDQLLDFARGPDSDAYDRAIDTQISRLRRKLDGHSHNELIKTIRNEGYMFSSRVEKM